MIYLIILFIFCLTLPAQACTPAPVLIYPMNAIVLLAFTGLLYFRRLRSEHIVAYVTSAFLLGLLGPSTPMLLPGSFLISAFLFFSSLGIDEKKENNTKGSGCVKSIIYSFGTFTLLILMLLYPIILGPLMIILLIAGLIIFSIKKTTHGDELKATENKEEVPKKQKIAAGIIFIIVLLTAPLYAIYIGTDVKAIIMFFSLLMLVLGMLLIRSIIRKAGIPREEWISRVTVSGVLFFTVAVMTWGIKINTFFNSSLNNYMSVLFIKKAQFIIVFALLLFLPVIFLFEEYFIKKRLKSVS